jgi:ADP-ribosylglycohydrolase
VNEQANNSARPNVHSDTVSANIGHGRAPKIVKCDGAAEQESYDYAGRRGWQIVEEFIDQGVSGGSAMRVAPLGAYFADDPERIADQARLSAMPTHSHAEAAAGAVAVAVAAGLAWQMRNSAEPPK